MSIVDFTNSHFNPKAIRLLRKEIVVVVVIPTGYTMYTYIRSLDISIFSTIKKQYTDVAEEYLEQYGSWIKIKLTSLQLSLCTRLTVTVWWRKMVSVDFKDRFEHIGYIWTKSLLVSSRILLGYTFDRITIGIPSIQIDREDNEEEARQIKTQAKLVEDRNKNLFDQKNKQATLVYFWKNLSNYVRIFVHNSYHCIFCFL